MPNVVRRHFDSKGFDKKRFIAAVIQMRKMPAPGFPNLYDKYIVWHATAGFNLVAHGGLAFLAWHRAFLWEFEKDLQTSDIALGKDGRIGVPWWDWTKDTSTDPTDARGRLWHEDFLGPKATPVNKGHFIEADWPGGPLLAAYLEPNYLHRDPGLGPLATAADILFAVGLLSFDVAPFDTTAPETSFRNVLEGHRQRGDGTLALHNAAHGWIGGNMNNVNTSPFDPAFWLNHANVDRIWAIWQTKHPRLADQWPATGVIKPVPLTITTAGVGYTNGVYSNVPLATLSGTGSGARSNITVAGGAVTAATVVAGGSGYAVGDKVKVEAVDLGGGSPSTTMVLTIPSNGTADEIDIAYPPPGPRPPSVLKLDEPMLPWDGSAGTRIWTPKKVLNWQKMAPAGEHQYRYSTDPSGSFKFS